MTNPYLALESVSYVLPDGRALFTDLTEVFDQRATGLVGRNGIGKSVLARILAGELRPSSGQCIRQGHVYYLAQQTAYAEHTTVADVAGVGVLIAALERIAQGSVDPADFALVGEQWTMRECLQAALDAHGFINVYPHTRVNALSGGQVMQVALIGAFLSEADFLILDEPTNHLDQEHRAAFISQLDAWRSGLLVISHDRQLLATMTRIVELSSMGLRSYGGGYAFYAQSKEQETAHAATQLAQRKSERKREERALHVQQERQERREASGHQRRRDANQAKILLDRQKERSQSSAGKLRQLHDSQRAELSARVNDAARQVDDAPIVTLYGVDAGVAAQRQMVQMDNVVLPFLSSPLEVIDLTLVGPVRVGVTGPNGSGKSTLLKVIAGQLPPLQGQCGVFVKCVYLDQQLAGLDQQQSLIGQLMALNRVLGEAALRSRLAQMGLNAQKAQMPCGLLSGGERLKAALACALYADPPAQLILLDEPSNHLDLASVEALELMLNQYKGGLMVVSHDPVLLEHLGLTHRLCATPLGWQYDAL